jgi:CRISPR-associated endoribonuclease Cas6
MTTTRQPKPAKKTVTPSISQKPVSAKTSRPATSLKKTSQAKKEPSLNLSARTLWPKSTELISLEFTLRPLSNCSLYPQYTIGLHAWFLQQIRELDPDLSAYLHNGESEKPFSLTGLDGQFVSHSQSLQLQSNQTYYWRLSALSQRVAQGLETWLKHLPDTLALKDAPLAIESVRLAQSATTYAKLLRQGKDLVSERNISLSFASPTSFRRKGHHLPLPWPTNVFHSYLRRWNHFAKKQIDPENFLDWIDSTVIIQRHQLASTKIAAGKQGSVTGFTGAITYALARDAAEQPDFQAMFYTLTQLAPYCGTGHKTTFGLGETHLGWSATHENPMPAAQQLLAQRIEELTALFMAQKKRQGGSRAQETAEKWATILARREQGDGLDAIAQDMSLPYETAKTYSKLARKAVKETTQQA